MHFSLRDQLQQVFSAQMDEEPKQIVADIESGFKGVFSGESVVPPAPVPEVVEKGCAPKGEHAEEMSEEDKKKKQPAKKEQRFAAMGFDHSPLPEVTPVKKFNPHHGADGRFTSAGGGAKWTSFNRFELQMTDAQSRSASGPGRADEAVDALLQDAGIQKQLDQIDPQKIRDELYEYGAWDKEELSDDRKNRARIVWIAAGNIADGN